MSLQEQALEAYRQCMGDAGASIPWAELEWDEDDTNLCSIQLPLQIGNWITFDKEFSTNLGLVKLGESFQALKRSIKATEENIAQQILDYLERINTGVKTMRYLMKLVKPDFNLDLDIKFESHEAGNQCHIRLILPNDRADLSQKYKNLFATQDYSNDCCDDVATAFLQFVDIVSDNLGKDDCR